MSLEHWAHLGTIIEALVVFCAAVFAVIQVREAVRARSLDCFLPLSRDLKEQTKARRSIYTRFRELAQEGIDRWEGVPKTGPSRRSLATLRRVFGCDTARCMPELISMPVIPQDSYESLESQDPMLDGEKEDVESVCVTFDRMGVLVKYGLIPKDVAFSMYFDVVLRTWYLVQPFVQAERKRRKSDIWMMHFEDLSVRCWKHWRELLKDHPEWEHMKEPTDILRYT